MTGHYLWITSQTLPLQWMVLAWKKYVLMVGMSLILVKVLTFLLESVTQLMKTVHISVS